MSDLRIEMDILKIKSKEKGISKELRKFYWRTHGGSSGEDQTTNAEDTSLIPDPRKIPHALE